MIPQFDVYQQRHHVYAEAVISPGLTRIEIALEKLGAPHRKLKVIHVAGTNGKGSTVAFLDALCQVKGWKVGTFTSPAIIDVHDQIKINGASITTHQMDNIFQQLKKYQLQLTEFELLTVIALYHFAEEQVDIAVIEAGLGGLEDSTNVVVPAVSVITSIALEHTHFLGNTLTSIAKHKGGIIKQAPVVTGILPQEAQQVIQKIAQQKKVQYIALHQHFSIDAQRYDWGEISYTNLQPQLLGEHQQQNMAVAITAFLLLGETLSAIDVQQAVHNANILHRFEQVSPDVYFDGAHNPASAQQLIDTIRQCLPSDKISFAVGMVRDKDLAAVLAILEQVSETFYFIEFNNERAAKAEQLYALSQAKHKSIVNDVPQVQGTLIVTGSLYLLASLREKLICATQEIKN